MTSWAYSRKLKQTDLQAGFQLRCSLKPHFNITGIKNGGISLHPDGEPVPVWFLLRFFPSSYVGRTAHLMSNQEKFNLMVSLGNNKRVKTSCSNQLF